MKMEIDYKRRRRNRPLITGGGVSAGASRVSRAVHLNEKAQNKDGAHFLLESTGTIPRADDRVMFWRQITLAGAGHIKIPGTGPGITNKEPSVTRIALHSSSFLPLTPKAPFLTRALIRSALAALLSSLTGAEYLIRFAAHSKYPICACPSHVS